MNEKFKIHTLVFATEGEFSWKLPVLGVVKSNLKRWNSL